MHGTSREVQETLAIRGLTIDDKYTDYALLICALDFISVKHDGEKFKGSGLLQITKSERKSFG